MSYYPILLNIQDRLVAVIGGGEVALRKVKDLLEAGARMRIVSPQFHPEIESLAASHPGRIALVRRRYEPGDLAGTALAFSTTDSPGVNRAVFAEAEERGIFLNAVDDPPNCSFIVPSTTRKGGLIIAVSTGGASPAMAAKLRRRLEAAIPDDIGEVLDALAAARELLKSSAEFAHLPSPRRGSILKEIVADDAALEEMLSMARAGKLAEFLESRA